MKAFLLGLLAAAINGAAQTTAAAGENGANLKTTGAAAGAGGIAGALTFVLGHPIGKHPATDGIASGLVLPAALQPRQGL
jgi:hypothetical protein